MHWGRGPASSSGRVDGAARQNATREAGFAQPLDDLRDMIGVTGLDDHVDVGALGWDICKESLMIDLNDIPAGIANHLGQQCQLARTIDDLDPQARRSAVAHQAAVEHAGEQANVDVSPSNDSSHPATRETLAMRQHGGDGGRAGTFRHNLLTLHEIVNGGLDRLFVYEQDLRHQFLDRRPGQFARLLDGNAVGEGCTGTSCSTASQSLMHRGIKARLHAEDFDFRPQCFDGCGDSGDQTAATDGYDDTVKVGEIFEKLKADGSLTCNNKGIVIGMDEGEAFLFCNLTCRHTGGIKGVAGQLDPRAEGARSLYL